MTEYRCKFCHKLLFKATDWGDGGTGWFEVEIKCSKCKKRNKIDLS